MGDRDLDTILKILYNSKKLTLYKLEYQQRHKDQLCQSENW